MLKPPGLKVNVNDSCNKGRELNAQHHQKTWWFQPILIIGPYEMKHINGPKLGTAGEKKYLKTCCITIFSYNCKNE
jgi:hypothetical protein